MPWFWDPSTGDYYDPDTGQRLDAAAVRELMEERQRKTADKIAALMAMFTGLEFIRRLWQLMLDEYTVLYLLGRGGLAQMTAADWAAIDAMVAGQEAYLAGFAQDLEDEELSEAQKAARALLYLGIGRAAFEQGQAGTQPEANEVQWVLGVADHCDDCLGLAGLGWQPKEPWPFAMAGAIAFPANGATVCFGNCKCGIEYRTVKE